MQLNCNKARVKLTAKLWQSTVVKLLLDMEESEKGETSEHNHKRKQYTKDQEKTVSLASKRQKVDVNAAISFKMVKLQFIQTLKLFMDYKVSKKSSPVVNLCLRWRQSI